MTTGVSQPILEPLKYPEQDPKLSSKRFFDLMTIVGPGFILASVTIGNGEIFSATRGGAVFGYAILWTFLIGAVLKASVVYAAGRYMVITGEHPFARMGHLLPGVGHKGIGRHWLAVFFGLLAVVCFPAWCVAYLLALSQWTPWTFGIGDGSPILWMGIAWILLGWATLFIKDFTVVERFQTVVVGLMVIFSIIAMFVSSPAWGEVARGLLPTVPAEYPQWVQQNFPSVAERAIPMEIISYLGALGGGIYDYIGYVGTFREKTWGMMGRPDNAEINAQLQALGPGQQIPLDMSEENLEGARLGVKAVKIDSVTSFVAVAIFAVTFMVLGSVILGTGGLQEVPADTNILQNQANFFTQIHPALKYLYQLAIFAAFWGSVQALLTVTYPYTVREAFAPVFPAVANPANWHKLKVGVASYTAGVAIFLALTGVSYTVAISFAGILGGVFGLGLWGFVLVYAEHKMLPQRLRMKPFMQGLVIVSSLVMTVMGAIALVQFFQSL